MDSQVASSNSDRIVAQVEKWLGTPYHHGADVLGVGVDCAMLPVRVFCDLGLVPPFDPRPYPHDWFLHRSDERYRDWVAKFGDQVETPERGDLALFRVGRCFAHGGIVVSPHQMIHADIHADRVERADIAAWCRQPHEFWRVR